jgi:hypothetical protein
MSDLTLEELNEYIFGCCRERENELLPKIIAAARAHLERLECVCEPFLPHGQACPVHNPKPPQQREDDGRRNDSVSGADNASGHDLGADKYVVTPALKQREGWWTKHWASGEAL